MNNSLSCAVHGENFSNKINNLHFFDTFFPPSEILSLDSTVQRKTISFIFYYYIIKYIIYLKLQSKPESKSDK